MTVLEGDIIVKRVSPRWVVQQAPPRSRMSLELLRAAGEDMTVRGNLIDFAGQVTYRVVGWEPNHLLLERADGGM